MAARILRAVVVIVKDCDEDGKKMEIATRRRRKKEDKVPGRDGQELVHYDCLSTHAQRPSRSSIQDHHITRQTPQALVKTICSTRLLDSSLSVSVVGGLIKGDEHSRLGQSTPRVPQTASLIGCNLDPDNHMFLF